MKWVSTIAAVLLATGLVGEPALAAAAPASGPAAPSPGIITTLAGGPGRGVPTRLAQIPLSVAEGIGGAVYVGGDGVVREFTRISSPATVAAGVGSIVGNAYNGRPASKTVVGEITGMALDAAGNLVMADISDYGEIDKLQVVAAKSGTFYGHAMTAGRLYSITPQLRPTGLAIDSAGNVVTSDSEVGQVQVLAVRTGIFYGQGDEGRGHLHHCREWHRGLQRRRDSGALCRACLPGWAGYRRGRECGCRRQGQ